MKGKLTIASVAIEIMKSGGSFDYKTDRIDLGNYGLLDDIWFKCEELGIIKRHRDHPLDRQCYIMNQLRKSNLFVKVGNISYPGFQGYSRCTVLRIKE